MTAAARKKKNEFGWFQMFQRISPDCPQGKPLRGKREEPDIIFPKLALGIEITEYILGQGCKGSPLRRLETVRRRIVRDAQAGYETHGGRGLQVTVMWHNSGCPRKSEEDQLAKPLHTEIARVMGLKLWQVDQACSFLNGWAPDASISCFWLWWQARMHQRRVRREKSIKHIAKRFGVMEATVAAWRKKGAPIDDDVSLAKWLVTRRSDAKAQRDSLKQCVVQLYEKQFGAKAIAKMVGVGPDIARTLLMEAGVYQPGRLKHLGGWSVDENGERVRCRSTAKQQVLREIQRARRTKYKRTVKTSDLPLFQYVNRAKNTACAVEKFGRRYREEVEFRIIQILRSRLRKVAKRGRGYSGSNLKWLGCTPIELRQHLERQFQPGMHWNNLGVGAGKWNIDHKVPCAKFDMLNESERLACFHYTNLRPLWSELNIAKGAIWNGVNYQRTKRNV
jgi:Prasinovirus endonuclease VII